MGGRIFYQTGGGPPCRLGVLKPCGPGKALHLLAGQFAHGQTAKRLKYRRYPRLKTDKPNDLIDEYGTRAVNPTSASCSRARVLITEGELAS